MTHGVAPMPASGARETLAITGSKGGVGKSNLVLNLAVSLGRWGRRVLLVDGDLGLANLDVLLGLMPTHTVEHLVRGVATLDDVLLEGPHGIRILPAASGVPDLSRLDGAARRVLLQSLNEAARDVDDVLVDTGAGLGDATVALQLAASRVLVVTTPEPTSLVDAYATLKVLWQADPHKRVDLVVNAAADDDEAVRIHDQLARAARHFLGHEPGCLGPVYRDVKVGEAVRRQKAVVELFPNSRAAGCYERIALQLTSAQHGNVASPGYWERLLMQSEQELLH